jgi:predicted secreted protein
MTLPTGLATFFLIWWVTLFAVLPWGVRSQHEGGEMVQGTDPGAPVSFRLGPKLLWTTLVAAVIFAAWFVVYTERLISLDGLMRPFVHG